jgi:hypothetical protein
MSRLRSRIDVVKNRRRRPESYTALKLLTTEDLRRALVLIERGGVLANGDVRNPEVYRHASREELEALERWTQLCGQTLDHLEAAEELLDRMGDAYGWALARSHRRSAAARTPGAARRESLARREDGRGRGEVLRPA